MLSPVFTEYQGKRFVFFSSPHSDNGCLSNWYESSFSLDARVFASAEQAFLYLKALSSHDEATALRVFAMNDPQYFARLNHQIRPFDARRWAERREAAMRQIVHEKFVQSEELTDFLLSTGDALIVNCSKNPVWSCGLQLTQIERLDQARWVGQNLLGQILMDLRQELRPPEPEPEPEVEPVAVPEPETPSQPELEKPATEPVATPSTSAENTAPAEDMASSKDEAMTQPTAEAEVATPAEPGQPTDDEMAEATAAESTPKDEEDQPATVEPAGDTPAEDAGKPQQAQPEQEPLPQQTEVSPSPEEPGDDTPQPAQDAPATPDADGDETVLMPRAEATDQTVILADAQETELMPKPADTAEAQAVPASSDAPASDSPNPTKPALVEEETTTEGTAALPIPSRQEPSAVVDRYQRNDYPTADELADGSILKALIQTFTRSDSPAVRQALMQCLRDSVVAVTAVRVDPLVAATAPVREDGLSDPLIMDNGSTYRPSILENDAGQRWFPAFSSPAEITSEISSQTSVIMLPMSKCVDLARTRGDLAGITVNVFTDNLILPGRTCDYIAGLPSHAKA